MKQLLLSSALFLLATTGQAQPNPRIPFLDSALLAERVDSNRAKLATELSSYEVEIGENEDARKHIDQALVWAKRSKNTVIECFGLMGKGYVLARSGNPKEGLLWLAKSRAMAVSLNSKALMTQGANKTGIAWFMAGNGDSAFAYQVLALELLEKWAPADSLERKMEITGFLFDGARLASRDLEAEPYIVELLRLTRKLKNVNNEAYALAVLGAINQQKGDYKRSLAYCNEEIRLAGDSLPHIANDGYMRVATIFSSLDDLPRSVEYFNKALRYYEKNKDELGIAQLKNNLGEVYMKHKDYQKALQLFTSALTFTEKQVEPQLRASLLHNIGMICKDQGDRAGALKNFRAALKINDSIKYAPFLCQNHSAIGAMYLEDKKYDSALYHFAITEKLAKANNLVSDEASSASNMGKLYLAKALDSTSAKPTAAARSAYLAKAIRSLEDGAAKASNVGVLSQLQDLYTDLSTAYKASGNYKSSMEYFEKAIAIKDSIFSKEKSLKIARLEGEAALAQKNEEVALSREEAARLKRQRMYWYLGGGGIMLLATISLLAYRSQRKRKEKLMKTEFEKQVAEMEMQALRAQMNPHFIFNCLNSINRYIVKSDSTTASGYLTKFSKLIRLILDHSASGTTSLASEKQMLQLYLEMESLRFSKKFSYNIDLDEGLEPDSINIPAMLVQPYIENAIWHGLMHKESAGHLSVHFSEQQEGMLQVVITDNGVGRAQAALLKSKSSLKEKSHGMRITGDRLRLVSEQQGMDASVEVEDLADASGAASGTRVTLNIPYAIA